MRSTSSIHSTGEPRGELLLGVMVTGALSLTAVIALMSVVGSWAAFVVAIGGLLAAAAGVMVAVARLLARTGDETPHAATPGRVGPRFRPPLRVPRSASPIETAVAGGA